MAFVVSEEDEESLRKQCENASLEDVTDQTKKVGPKGQLPPIKLGMSFSDWKQKKEAEQDNTSIKPERLWKPPAQIRQKQNFSGPFFESNQLPEYYNNNQISRSQQQNFPNFNAFPPRPNNQQGRRNFFQDQAIPPLKPPPAFDDVADQRWYNGPLMQPMFPPMPRKPRLQQQGMRTNTSGQYNNRFLGQKRPSASLKPKSGQTGFRTASKPTKKESSREKNTPGNSSEGNKTVQDIRTEPQVYIYRPRNPNRPEKFKTNWIVLPKAPPPMNANTPESREEKARLWREYRQAMKPFKNREFKNAKRVIQRLGKKDLNELDEKQRERLDRANELVNSHKAMLNERIANRSARIEKEVKSGNTGQNSSHNWVVGKSMKESYKGDAQNSTQSQSRQSMPANSFISGGFLQPLNS